MVLGKYCTDSNGNRKLSLASVELVAYATAVRRTVLPSLAAKVALQFLPIRASMTFSLLYTTAWNVGDLP